MAVAEFNPFPSLWSFILWYLSRKESWEAEKKFVNFLFVAVDVPPVSSMFLFSSLLPLHTQLILLLLHEKNIDEKMRRGREERRRLWEKWEHLLTLLNFNILFWLFSRVEIHWYRYIWFSRLLLAVSVGWMSDAQVGKWKELDEILWLYSTWVETTQSL